MNRNDVFAITNAKTNEVGEEVLSERSELRNLTLSFYLRNREVGEEVVRSEASYEPDPRKHNKRAPEGLFCYAFSARV